MDTIPSVQRKSMPPDSRFSFVIILRYDPIAYSEFPAGGPGPGGAGPGPRTIPARSDCADRRSGSCTLCSFGGDVPRRVCRSSAVRAGCGVGAGRAGRASTPFHAGTAGPGRARARRPPRDAAGAGSWCVYRI
jgi:hypothetical protein